jgi:hypothetical protein
MSQRLSRGVGERAVAIESRAVDVPQRTTEPVEHHAQGFALIGGERRERKRSSSRISPMNTPRVMGCPPATRDVVGASSLTYPPCYLTTYRNILCVTFALESRGPTKYDDHVAWLDTSEHL